MQGEVQEKLNELAKLANFAIIINEEAAARQLLSEDILHSVKSLYQMVSQHTHGNDGTVFEVYHGEYYTSNECAAFIAYFKLQGAWGAPFAWEELRILEGGRTWRVVERIELGWHRH